MVPSLGPFTPSPPPSCLLPPPPPQPQQAAATMPSRGNGGALVGSSKLALPEQQVQQGSGLEERYGSSPSPQPGALEVHR
jgi:hypothetical protein